MEEALDKLSELVIIQRMLEVGAKVKLDVVAFPVEAGDRVGIGRKVNSR